MGWFTSREHKDKYAANESGPPDKPKKLIKVGGVARSAIEKRKRAQEEALKKY